MAPGVKYLSKKYPFEPKSVGEYIKKRRIDLNLLQREVAVLIGVSEDCITYWENGRSTPQVQHAPAIISFLGCNPFERPEQTFGDRVWNYRYRHGLSHKKMGVKMGVDGSTVCSWENNEFMPHSATLKAFEILVQL
ncbi:MAG TPA: helix-turn-helix transcriptional regulator [Bacteroidia bacterium]|nr:helix-turn-helix transcriptional regulator [Bacteroidia bacterium]